MHTARNCSRKTKQQLTFTGPLNVKMEELDQTLGINLSAWTRDPANLEYVTRYCRMYVDETSTSALIEGINWISDGWTINDKSRLCLLMLCDSKFDYRFCKVLIGVLGHVEVCKGLGIFFVDTLSGLSVQGSVELFIEISKFLKTKDFVDLFIFTSSSLDWDFNFLFVFVLQFSDAIYCESSRIRINLRELFAARILKKRNDPDWLTLRKNMEESIRNLLDADLGRVQFSAVICGMLHEQMKEFIGK